MTALTNEQFLPKEPLDLPVEIPARTENTYNVDLQDKQEEDFVLTEVKTLLTWHAPGRPFRKRGKEYYLSGLLIMLLVEIILFLFSEYILMMVVFSLIFVAFALVSIPPQNFYYRISTEGITIEDHFFLWQELYDFYFKKRDGTDVLHIRTHALLPGELTLTLGDMHRDHIKTVLLPYLPYREIIRPTFMEKSGDWLARNFPLENASKAKKS